MHYEYLLYLPLSYSESEEAWPLVIFLHGSGEYGADLNMVRAHGPPRLITEGRDFPFMVVAPQAPEIQPWDIDALDLLLDEIMRTHHVDPDRIYLTGMSNGGKGAWTWAIARPDRLLRWRPSPAMATPTGSALYANFQSGPSMGLWTTSCLPHSTPQQ